jgi:short-subunit dehydrogenase
MLYDNMCSQDMSTAVIIVGSSRGFGKSLLQTMMQFLLEFDGDQKLIFVLLTTSAIKTKIVFNEVYRRIRGCEYGSEKNSSIEVIIEEVDLFKVPNIAKVCDFLEISLQRHQFRVRKIYAFINSGSIEPVGPLLHKTGKALLSEKFTRATELHVNLNFISFVALTRALSQYCISHDIIARIVNISSLAAIQELYGMAIYSAIKSARESFIRSLALEIKRDESNPDIKYLNYAPGPMCTDIVKESLVGVNSADNHVKNAKLDFIDPDVSARCCCDILFADEKWESGCHIDFYDVSSATHASSLVCEDVN